jgi:DNA-binding HxlR family transcriptional regulator
MDPTITGSYSQTLIEDERREKLPALDPETQVLFERFGDNAKKFTREIEEIITPGSQFSPAEMSKIRIHLARTVFSKWSIEILTVLYSLRLAGYSDLKKGVGRITSRILSQKLKVLEKAGLIQRSVIATRPPTVRYSLTDKGFNVARIAEPVFLYGAAIEQLYNRPRFLLERR